MPARILVWITHKIISWVGMATLLMLLLLLTALGSMTMGLADVIRGFDTGLMSLMVILGLLIGWLLAKSPLPGWLAAIIILILGSEVIALRVGQLGRALTTFLWALSNLAWETRRWLVDRWLLGDPPDYRPTLQTLAELWAGFYTLLIRLFDWSTAMIAGQPAYDPVATTLVWSLALWLVAAWASWAVRRRGQPLLALTPAGALLATTLSFRPKEFSTLAPLLAATLLLIALVRYKTRENRWEATGLDFALDVRLDLTMFVVPLALALVMLATVTPSLSVRQIAQLAQRLMGVQVAQTHPLASSLGVEAHSGPASILENVQSGGLPRHHLLGSGPELSKQVVLVIQTNDTPPTSPHEPPPRYYWRSLTYDRYTGRGWFTGRTKTVEYEAGEPAISMYETSIPDQQIPLPARRALQQQIRDAGDLDELIYAAGELITVDQDFSVAWRAPGDVFGATIDATTYQVESLLSVAGETQLRAAGSNYPAWVQRYYLNLPDEIPNRVLTLARDLTATAPTPYDRARAIESYLRAFPYSLDLPLPPRHRDVVDYFLFDLQQGYCDYYATSMVVLARAAGLPARLAVGYISGIYDPAQARYIVTEADAHSWVEIYFPRYGWINFEPTGSRPAIERPSETPPVVPPELELPLAEAGDAQAEGGVGIWRWLLALPGGLALLALGGVGWSIVDGWRLRRLPPAKAIAILYRRLYRHGQWLDTPVEIGATPYEFVTSLAGHVTGLAQKRRWGTMLIPAAQELHWLTDLYVQTLYSPHRPALADRNQAIQLWRRLQRRLWLAQVYVFSKRPPARSTGSGQAHLSRSK